MQLFKSDDQIQAEREGAELQERFNQLYQDQLPRLNRYREFTNEYERSREHRVNDAMGDYGRTRNEPSGRHDIPLPYAHAIVMKHTYRIAGRLPDLIADRLDNSRYELFRADAVEKILYSVYQASGAEMAFADAAHDGSLLGPGCFQVHWDIDRDQPRFRAVNPRHVLVVPGLDDPHDFQESYYWHSVPLTVFRKRYGNVQLADGATAADCQADENGRTITIVDHYDAFTWTRFAGGHILAQRDHNYGFVPYVVVPNLGPAREIWGYSDYEFFRHVAAYYEALVSRQADVIRATANGSYIVKDTGQDPAKVKKIIADGGILPVRKEGSVDPIVPGEFGAGFVEHLTMVRDAINDLGFTPPASWGTLGAASGSDRALQLAPQIELTALKQINWSAGLRRLNTMILRLVETKTLGKTSFRGKKTRGAVVTPFTITLNAAASENFELVDKDGNPELDPEGNPIELPTNPRDLIAGNYSTEVVWERRLDRDDPQFVLSELNKFAQGAQSLRTTLERLGFESPEDEMNLIEEEADRFPWLRQGMIALINAQLQAQSKQDPSGGGGDLSSGLASLFSQGGGQSGALNADALNRGLNGSSNAGSKGSGPNGATYGAA